MTSQFKNLINLYFRYHSTNLNDEGAGYVRLNKSQIRYKDTNIFRNIIKTVTLIKTFPTVCTIHISLKTS